MDFIQFYIMLFLVLNLLNMIRNHKLSTHIIFSVALEIPIIGRIFMWW